MQPLPSAMFLVAIVRLESFKSIKTPWLIVIMEFIKLLWFLVVCEERGSCFLPSSFQICPSYFLCSVLRLCCCRCHISHKLQNQVAWPFLAQTWRTFFFKSVFHKMQVQTLITYVVLLNGSILLSPCGFDHLSP